ncbi:hypothetical protein PAXRUDRAFT_230143 [Paxillus rubicundulus Ve08.2h10]|uniref:Uncharacterized protein n=1 Tax=Paxillus rubicundulus Ve08.2h10 TaxID=930991 RepID=A0A0D0DTP9_9AGAM|nr:hypothetical protein PAXRUDRAFT_230143 [Paxillus rubicundulus Ve08.2h10]
MEPSTFKIQYQECLKSKGCDDGLHQSESQRQGMAYTGHSTDAGTLLAACCRIYVSLSQCSPETVYLDFLRRRPPVACTMRLHHAIFARPRHSSRQVLISQVQHACRSKLFVET